MAYLKEQIESKEKELFLVVSREVDSNQGWLTESCEKKDSNEKSQESIEYVIKETVFDGMNGDVNLTNSKENVNENGNFCNNQSLR